jgi:DNA-binding MarR family transcriptional regulator
MTVQVDPNSFGFLVTDLARLLRGEFDKRVCAAGVGVTPGEARTLAHVARAGAVRQSVLAERMGVEAMTLSSFLDRLEAQGLVARRTDPTDRRAKLVDLTDAADEVLIRLQTAADGLRAQAAAALGEDEWPLFISMLKRVREAVSAPKPGSDRSAAA